MKSTTLLTTSVCGSIALAGCYNADAQGSIGNGTFQDLNFETATVPVNYPDGPVAPSGAFAGGQSKSPRTGLWVIISSGLTSKRSSC